MKKRKLHLIFSLLGSWIFSCSVGSALAKPLTVAELALYKGADRQQILEEGARKEGKLILYTTQTEPITKPMLKAFQRKYPYIKVESWRGSNATLVPRLLEEYKARVYQADVVRATQSGEVIIREAGLLQPFYSPETVNMEQDVIIKAQAEGVLAVGNCESVRGLGYNVNLITKEEVPKTYQDLLEPKWKGKMAISGTDTGVSWLGAMAVTYGEKFVMQFEKQGISVHMVSARALLDIISNGEYIMSPTITDAHVIASRKKGAPVNWIPLEPAVVELGRIILPRHSTHPYAAMLYIDFELSHEAGNIYKSIGYSSPRKDVPGEKNYKKFYGAKSTKEVAEWKALFNRLFLKNR